MAATRGFQGALLITSTPSVNVPVNMALQDSGDHMTFTMTTGNAAYRYWDDLSGFTFQTSGDGVTAWTNATPASVQYVNGRIVFSGPISGATPSARVTAGKYFPYALVANITSWHFDGQWTFADVTSLQGGIAGGGGSGAKAFQPQQLEGTMAITKFWVPEASEGYVGGLTSNSRLILAGVTESGNRFEGYAYDKKLGLKLDVAKPADHTLDFQLSGPFYGV